MVVYDIGQICPGKCSQIVAALTASLLSVSDGMQTSWSSPIVPRLLSSHQIKQDVIVWLENLFVLGGLIGLVLTIYLLDKVGRKNTILISSALSILAWTLMIVRIETWVLLLGRLMAGVSGNIFNITAPIYIGEISEKTIRGRLESTIYVMMNVGIILVYSVGPSISIPNTNAIGALICVIQFAVFLVMPESPYYLIMKQRQIEAQKNLRILRSCSDVEEELVVIIDAVNEENVKPTHLLDLFRVHSNRKALLICGILTVAQELGGMTVLLMNLQTILSDITSSTMKLTVVPIIFALLFGMSFIASAFLIDFLGRRKSLIISCFSTSFFLFIIAFYFTAQKLTANTEHFSWIIIIVILLFTLTYTNGIALVPTVLTAELFPTNIKAFGCSLTDSCFIIGSSLSIFLYNYLSHSVGNDAPFYIFAVCTSLTGIFTIFVVPETKGKTLHEIQKILKHEDRGDSYKICEKENLLQ